MKINNLEKEILVKFFEEMEMDVKVLHESLDKIQVLSRDYTGVGFFTTLEKHECLRVKDNHQDPSLVVIAAYLNEEKIQVGFVFHFEKGFLETIEGFSYGDQLWPEEIISFEIY
jgi:hypothetical protein